MSEVEGKRKRRKFSFEEVESLIENNDIEGIKSAIGQGLNVNKIKYMGPSILHSAIYYDRYEIIEILASHPHIDIDIVEPSDKETPLIYAAHYGKTRAVEILLTKGANAALTNGDGQTSLMLAAKHNRLECFKILLNDKNCSPNAQEKNWKTTTLMYAIWSGGVEIVRLLVEVSDLSLTDNNDCTALHCACNKGSLEIVKLIAEKSVSELENTEKKMKETPLLSALRKGFLDIADYLIEKGADMTAKNFKARSVYDYAAMYDRSETFLIKHEAGIRFLNETFKLLVDYSRFKTLKVYASKCIKCFAGKHPNGPLTLSYAVIYAIDKGSKEAAIKLLSALFFEESSDLNPNDARKIKRAKLLVLEHAIKGGHKFVTDYYLERGLDPNDEIIDGYSYLIQACQCNNVSFVRSLIKLGADIHAKDTHGFTPLLTSAIYGHTEAFFEMFFIDKDLSQRSNGGLTPFLAACKSGKVLIVRVLLESGSCVTDVDTENRNCLHHATEIFTKRWDINSELIELLYDKLDTRYFKTMINATDSSGNRPVDALFQLKDRRKLSNLLKSIPDLKEFICAPIFTNIYSGSQEICLICRDDYFIYDNAVVLPCKHVFHENCYSEWSNIKKICPYCQKLALEVKQ